MREESKPKGGAQLSPSRSGKQLPHHSWPVQCSLQTTDSPICSLPPPFPSPSVDNPRAKTLEKT